MAATDSTEAAGTAAKTSSLLHGDVFWLDNFALRQWDDDSYQGTKIEYDKVLDACVFIVKVE